MADRVRPRLARVPAPGGSPVELARIVNGLIDGLSENTGRVTLEAGTTATVIRSPIFRAGTVLMLVPQSEAAAAVSWWQSTVERNAITVGHEAPADDVSFAWIGVG